MPKSRNRKDHKKKAAARTASLKAAEAKQKKAYIDMLNRFQEQMNQQQNQTTEIDDIGEIDDINVEPEIDVNVEPEIDVDIEPSI
jgi:uncharacterized protein YnzC (UPF0291/DUF896 family)